MSNRKQRRHSGKPHGMSYADQLAYKKQLREAATMAANDTMVEVKTQVNVQRALWLSCVAMNDAFQIGPARFQRYGQCLQDRADWFEALKNGGDEDYANDKLRLEAERCSGIKIESLYDEAVQLARDRHANNVYTNFERFRAAPAEKMAERMCEWMDCAKCPGRDLCSHSEGKGNGLVKWLKAEEEL